MSLPRKVRRSSRASSGRPGSTQGGEWGWQNGDVKTATPYHVTISPFLFLHFSISRLISQGCGPSCLRSFYLRRSGLMTSPFITRLLSWRGRGPPTLLFRQEAPAVHILKAPPCRASGLVQRPMSDLMMGSNVGFWMARRLRRAGHAERVRRPDSPPRGRNRLWRATRSGDSRSCRRGGLPEARRQRSCRD